MNEEQNEINKENMRIALDDVRINTQGALLLNDSAKWAKFISVFGLTMLALAVITFLIGALVTPGGERTVILDMFDQYYTFGYNPAYYTWGAFFIVLVISVIAAIPYIFQYNFAARVQKAFSINDMLTMTEAFRAMKSYYVYTGIIIMLQLVVFLAVFAMSIFAIL